MLGSGLFVGEEGHGGPQRFQAECSTFISEQKKKKINPESLQSPSTCETMDANEELVTTGVFFSG